MKPVIFLDIDGVIVTNREFMRNSRNFQLSNLWARELGVPYPFNKGAVKVLNEILEATGAEIILSSDWKKHWDLSQLHRIFFANKVIKSPIDVTGNYPASMGWPEKNRVSDIEKYLRTHRFIDDEDQPTRSWIVIDDLNISEFFPEHLRSRVFLTNDFKGLKQTGLKQKIINKLNEYDTKE